MHAPDTPSPSPADELDGYFVTASPPPPPQDGWEGLPALPPGAHDGSGPPRTPLWVLASVVVVGLAMVLGVVAFVAGAESPQATAGGEAVAVTADPGAAVLDPRAAENGYAVWAYNVDGTPVRWNPCEPIRWVYNGAGAPIDALGDITAALNRVGSSTGLSFRFLGATDEAPGRDRAPYQPDRYGDGWAPVLVAWAPPHSGGIPLSGTDRAVSIPVAVGDAEYDVLVSGQVIFNAEKSLDAGFRDRGSSWGAVMMHEFAHLVGLDHVEEPDELMFTYPGGGPVMWGIGDLAGLDAVGADGGCVDVPRATALEVVYEDGFGR